MAETVTRPTEPGVGSRARPGPRRGRLRRLLHLSLTVLVVALILLAAGWLSTPSVADAQYRVEVSLAAHSSPALAGAVPTRVADALLATEDSRFYRTPGIDPLSVARLPYALVRGQDPGGATLEQQLAKNLYEPHQGGIWAKAAEAVLALKLDRSWSKPQILRMYLDDGYYGHGFYGLTAASEGYFDVAPSDLTWAQASLLAGLLQAPSAFDPIEHPQAARARQAHVLDRLVAAGSLTRQQAATVAAQSWALRGQ